MPTKTRKLNGNNAKLAGHLGEQAVLNVLALSEPEVEVKTMQLERHWFSVELTQLERQPDKVYVIVAYSRGKTLSKGPRGKCKRRHEYSIEEAFKRGLTFALVNTDKLIELVKAGMFRVRWVSKNYRTKARFVAEFRLESIKEYCQSYVWEDTPHFVYNAPELVKALRERVITYVS
jgi:hypothetical protein